MSYFIANAISISKDLQSFKVKGGDNNVIPRSNYWSQEIPIEALYYELNSGNIDLRSKTEKALFIKHLVNELDFGGSWDEGTDYFHLYELPETKEEMSKVVDDCAKTAFNTDNKYYKDVLEQETKIYENFEHYRKKLDDFNARFLTMLKAGLKSLPKEKYVVRSDGWNKGYIGRLNGRRGASIYSNKESALQFGKYRALFEAKRFDNCTIELI